MYAMPRTKIFTRQSLVTVIGVLMVVAAVMVGAMLGEAAAPDSPAGAVVVVPDSGDTGLVGGGAGGGTGGVTGSTGGMMIGSAGGSGGAAGK